MFWKKKYIAVIVVSEQKTYNILRLKKFKTTDNTIRVSPKASHTVDVSKPTYQKGLKLFYFVDIHKGHLTFEKSKVPINPKMIDMIVKQSIVKQLTARLSERMLGSQLLNIIIGLAIGGLLGFIIGGYV